VILLFVAVGSLGSLLGRGVGRRLPQHQLRKVFAVFLFGIGLFILWQKLPFLK
jgi:uncharacterized membrane protein YfcA